MERPTPSYPYRDGDAHVLGPEVVATADRSMIAWQGETYLREDDGEGPNLITTLTVELTINSDPKDPFTEAEQLMEIKDRLGEYANVDVKSISRVRR